MKTTHSGTGLWAGVLALSALMLLNSCVGFNLVSQRPAVKPAVDAVAAASEAEYEITDEAQDPQVQAAAEQPAADTGADAVSGASEY